MTAKLLSPRVARVCGTTSVGRWVQIWAWGWSVDDVKLCTVHLMTRMHACFAIVRCLSRHHLLHSLSLWRRARAASIPKWIKAAASTPKRWRLPRCCCCCRRRSGCLMTNCELLRRTRRMWDNCLPPDTFCPPWKPPSRTSARVPTLYCNLPFNTPKTLTLTVTLSFYSQFYIVSQETRHYTPVRNFAKC